MSVNEALKENIKINGNTIDFTTQLDRNTYQEIKKIFDRIGGTYSKKHKNFNFEFDPSNLINEYLETGYLPKKNPYAYFPTPENLINDMIKVSSYDFAIALDEEYQSKIKILEPSAGQGGICDMLLKQAPHVKIDTVELDEVNQKVLQDKGFNPYCMDFMDFNTNLDSLYDYIYMNPPFQGNTYIKHVLHAFKMLAHNGTLTAIVPTSFLDGDTNLDNELVELIGLCGYFYENEENSFAHLKTKVDTCIIVLNKAEIDWKLKNYQFHKHFYCWDFTISIMHCGDFYNQILNLSKKTNFRIQYKQIIAKAIESFIKNERDEYNHFLPLKFMDDYVQSTIEYIINIYEDDENKVYDISFLLENQTPVNNKEITNDTKMLYSSDTLKVFASGSLF